MQAQVLRTGPGYVTWGTLLFTVILVSLLSSAGSVYLYHRFFAIRLASFDLPGYLKGVQTEAAKAGPAQEKEMGEKIQKSMTAVEKLLTSQTKNTVILSGEVILGDSKPVTKLEAPGF